MPKIQMYSFKINGTDFDVQINSDNKGKFYVTKKSVDSDILKKSESEFNILNRFDTIEDLQLFIRRMYQYGCDNSLKKRAVFLIKVRANKGTDNLMSQDFDREMFVNQHFPEDGHGFGFSWRLLAKVSMDGDHKEYQPLDVFRTESVPSMFTDSTSLANDFHYSVMRSHSTLGGIRADGEFEIPATIENYKFIRAMEKSIASLMDRITLFFGNDSKELIGAIQSDLKLLSRI